MTDVEMQESVPLKSAEQAEGTETAAGAEGQQPAEGQPGEQKKEKKSWFSKKKAPKVEAQAGEEKGVEGGADGEGGANNVNDKKAQKGPKKCPFFNRSAKQQQDEGEQAAAGQQPSFQFNMVQRDDKKLHEAIDLGYEQVFGEPDAVHSWDAVWKTVLSVFLAVRNGIYKILALVLGIPLAVVFGVLFGVVSVLSVFVCVPIGRLLSIPFGWLAKVWSVVVGAICDPVTRSIGNIFGNVKVAKYGINQDATAVIA